MNKIFNDANDVPVAAYIVYANTNNNLFYDAACTEGNEVDADDCLNLFFKGVVCVKDDVYYAATSCTNEGVITFAFPAAAEDAGGLG